MAQYGGIAFFFPFVFIYPSVNVLRVYERERERERNHCKVDQKKSGSNTFPLLGGKILS